VILDAVRFSWYLFPAIGAISANLKART